MKLIALLLFVAVIGRVAAMPQNRPWNRPVLYRVQDESEESQEDEDEVQDDNPGEPEEDDEPPPNFSKLFPAAPSQTQQGPGVGGPNPFAVVSREIQKSGWNPPKRRRQQVRNRNRAEYLEAVSPRHRGLFRMAEESEEEEDDIDEEAEDDDPFPPSMEKMFPGLPAQSGQTSPSGGAPGGGQQRFSILPQGGRPRGPPQGSRGPPPNVGRGSNRRFRSGVVGPTYNSVPVSYVRRQQPMYAPARVQMPYRYPAAQYMYQNRSPVYNQRQSPYQRIPMSYVQRQPMPAYNRRMYQVPVQMSLPVRRYQQSPAMYGNMRRPSYYRSYRNRY